MSGKRLADASTPSRAPRQLKQTKLNWFTSSPRNLPDRPDLGSNASPDEPSTTTTAGQDEENADEGQLLEKQHSDSLTRPSDQVDNNNTSRTMNTPSQSSVSHPVSFGPGTTTSTTSTKPHIETSSPHPPPALSLHPSTSPIAGRIRVADRTGDLFAAPPNALLIHACNALGSWGGGIALAFRDAYRAAYAAYRAHCSRSTPDQLLGTALLIPPPPPPPPQQQPQQQSQKSSQPRSQRQQGQRPEQEERRRQHYIGCLFTSRRYGKARDRPESILRATAPAMRHLMRLVAEKEEEAERGGGDPAGVITEVRMCQINSGLFAVPWERTKRAIEEMVLGAGEVPRCAGEGACLEVVAYEREE